jgi:menaquinone-9 beta-reductase
VSRLFRSAYRNWGFAILEGNLADSCDVFVIGGGPAGLAAAICARRKGFEVTVADVGTPPIDKPCAEAVMPEGLAALERMGIDTNALAGCEIEGARFWNLETMAEARFPGRRGMGMRRIDLHAMLLGHAAKCGVNFLWRTRVTAISDGAVSIGDRLIHASWVIGADGGESRVRRWAGLDRGMHASTRIGFRRHYRVRPWSSLLEIYWGRSGQCYVTPISDDEVCVAVVSADPKLRLESAVEEFPALASRLGSAKASTTERGSFTSMRQLARVWSGRVALIGDASGGVDAITGEGLSLAFRQAPALADALASGDLSRYQVAHRRILRRPRMMARLMLMLGRHPGLRRHTTRVFSENPDLFDRFIAAHIGAVSDSNLAGSTLLVGWHMLSA